MASPHQRESTDPQEMAAQKSMLLQAAAQMDQLIAMFPTAPDKVKASAKNFRDSLREWADGKI